MAVVYLIRHGEPEGAGSFLGQSDPALAPGALDSVSKKLSELSVRIVYVSPLRRARETAACLQCRDVIVLPELREIGFGQWTGRTWPDIEREWPDLARRKLKDWTRITPPGGEDWEEFSQRIRRAWDRIRGGPSPAAVVAHGAVNVVFAQLAAGVPAFEFSQDYGEITELSYAAD